VRTFLLNRRGQVTDRYSTAVGQLSDAFAPVKIGGIHALGSVGSDSKRERDTVIQVLGAFIRLRSHELRASGVEELQPRRPQGSQRPTKDGSQTPRQL
jgi:hypothetical protein